jgi:cell division protein FtsW (lipid II flippase)
MAIIFPIAFLLFIYVELCVAVKPVLPLSLLRSRTPLCVGIIAGVIAIVNFNMLYHLPAIYEIVFQQPLSVAGAHLLPNSIAMTLSAPLMGLAIKRYRRYKWATVVCCAGPVIAMTLIATMTKSSNWAIQWLSVIPMGAGFSGLLTSTLIAMLNSVDSKSSHAP